MRRAWHQRSYITTWSQVLMEMVHHQKQNLRALWLDPGRPKASDHSCRPRPVRSHESLSKSLRSHQTIYTRVMLKSKEKLSPKAKTKPYDHTHQERYISILEFCLYKRGPRAMHARPKEGPHTWSKMLAEARHPQKQAAKGALPPLENSSAAIFRQNL